MNFQEFPASPLKIGRSHEPLLAEGQQNIFTARYHFHLPTKAQLEAGNPTRATHKLHAADLLADLRIPPSNRLETLSGDLKGFWRYEPRT